MNLDELQSIRDRERQSDSLQQLRETFYQDAGELVQELRAEREEAAARADDPFDAPEVNRLTDDIKTAEQTVEAIYERRVGKLVKMASFAAADMPAEDEGLTAEERELFEHLVAAIEHNRDHVLGVLDGEERSGSAVPGLPDGDADSAESGRDSQPGPAEGVRESERIPESEPTGSAPEAGSESTDGVDAADLMAGDAGDGDGESASPSFEGDADDPGSEADSTIRKTADGGQKSSGESDENPIPAGTAGGSDASSTAGDGRSDAETASEERTVEGSDRAGTDNRETQSSAGETTASTTRDADEPTTISRETVRITQEVGEILGVDQRSYDLGRDDVVMLPAENVDPLVERDAAERLE